MPARKKPMSAKQKKAELQFKRAQKRGDIEKTPLSAARRGRGREGRTNEVGISSVIDATRRLESSFVKFSPAFLEEAKRKASAITLGRPIPTEMLIFPNPQQDTACNAPTLTVMKRPKWNHDMSKKEVEANEAGMFKKWLEQSDSAVQRCAQAKNEQLQQTQQAEGEPEAPEGEKDAYSDRMPTAPSMFERNLEVWRQLWRVTEICQILLVLLDSRCPPLHYPPSLEKYLSNLRPARKIIFVLTKCDVSGPQRSALWTEYLKRSYPATQVVAVESYLTRSAGEGQGKRRIFEPHIPISLKDALVDALRAAHTELCIPPEAISSNPGRLQNWKPSVNPHLDWNAVRNAEQKDITHKIPEKPAVATENSVDTKPAAEAKVDDFISIGLIGQPNVGKSSLLNALFGTHKVKASKTPGKTKHFQTLFWTPQVRLVDCPGLVFPSFAQLELQVLAGVLPIAQLPAIPSSIHFALQHLPLEQILELVHPSKALATAADKRTWREGMKRPEAPSDSDTEMRWTTMDVLTAFAEKKGWITAKAGRPDVNRAGNAVLRMLAEGRIKWGFYPPGTDTSALATGYKCEGIWIGLEEKDDDDWLASDPEDESEASEYDSEDVREAESDETADENENEEENDDVNVTTVGGKFGALSLVDDGEDAESESSVDYGGRQSLWRAEFKF